MADTITIHGNLGGDPETRVLQSGATVTNLRVGSSHRVRDRQSGEWRDTHTNWFAVSAWDTLSTAAQRLRKGDPVTVIGSVRLNQWENGTAHGATLDVRADEISYDLRRGRRQLGEVQPAAPSGDPQDSAQPTGTGAVASDWGAAEFAGDETPF